MFKVGDQVVNIRTGRTGMIKGNYPIDENDWDAKRTCAIRFNDVKYKSDWEAHSLYISDKDIPPDYRIDYYVIIPEGNEILKDLCSK